MVERESALGSGSQMKEKKKVCTIFQLMRLKSSPIMSKKILT